jgi:hypothetical protein
VTLTNAGCSNTPWGPSVEVVALACCPVVTALRIGFLVSVLASWTVTAEGKSMICAEVCGGSKEDSGPWFSFTCVGVPTAWCLKGGSGFAGKWVLGWEVSLFSVEDDFGHGGGISESCEARGRFFWGLVATTGKLRAVLQIPEPFGFLGRSTLLCSGTSGSGSVRGSGTFLGLPLLPGTLNYVYLYNRGSGS